MLMSQIGPRDPLGHPPPFPNIVGNIGVAQEMDPSLFAPLVEAATLGSWFVYAPQQSPGWNCYVVGVIHLRDLETPEGETQKAQVLAEGMEYELVILALNPELDPRPSAPESIAHLSPLNLRVQFHGVDDFRAKRLGQMVVSTVCGGGMTIEPPAGAERAVAWKKAWDEIITHTLLHLAQDPALCPLCKVIQRGAPPPEPEITGPAGCAQRAALPLSPDFAAINSNWFLHFPSEQPVGDVLLASIGSLGDVPGCPPAHLIYAEATHEFVMSPLDPRTRPRPDQPNSFAPCSPPVMHFQFHGLAPERLDPFCRMLLARICDGRLPVYGERVNEGEEPEGSEVEWITFLESVSAEWGLARYAMAVYEGSGPTLRLANGMKRQTLGKMPGFGGKTHRPGRRARRGLN